MPSLVSGEKGISRIDLEREVGGTKEMLFHVNAEMYPTINLEDDKRLREVLGPQLQKMMQSGKVREAGILSGTRGGFFLVDIEAPEELLELMGPEIYANFKLEVHPVTPLDTIGELFQRWATEGR